MAPEIVGMDEAIHPSSHVQRATSAYFYIQKNCPNVTYHRYPFRPQVYSVLLLKIVGCAGAGPGTGRAPEI
jgi:hypothetical protein